MANTMADVPNDAHACRAAMQNDDPSATRGRGSFAKLHEVSGPHQARNAGRAHALTQHDKGKRRIGLEKCHGRRPDHQQNARNQRHGTRAHAVGQETGERVERKRGHSAGQKGNARIQGRAAAQVLHVKGAAPA